MALSQEGSAKRKEVKSTRKVNSLEIFWREERRNEMKKGAKSRKST